MFWSERGRRSIVKTENGETDMTKTVLIDIQNVAGIRQKMWQGSRNYGRGADKIEHWQGSRKFAGEPEIGRGAKNWQGSQKWQGGRARITQDTPPRLTKQGVWLGIPLQAHSSHPRPPPRSHKQCKMETHLSGSATVSANQSTKTRLQDSPNKAFGWEYLCKRTPVTQDRVQDPTNNAKWKHICLGMPLWARSSHPIHTSKTPQTT